MSHVGKRRSVTEPTCWITGFVLYNGRAGAGMAEFRAHRERALSSTTHDFAFLDERREQRIGFRGVKGRGRLLHMLMVTDGDGDAAIIRFWRSRFADA
jgi:hypothetical protein